MVSMVLILSMLIQSMTGIGWSPFLFFAPFSAGRMACQAAQMLRLGFPDSAVTYYLFLNQLNPGAVLGCFRQIMILSAVWTVSVRQATPALDSSSSRLTWFLSRHLLNWLMLGGTFRRCIKICVNNGVRFCSGSPVNNT